MCPIDLCAAAEATAAADPKKAKPVEPSAINVMSGKRYEEEFEFETKRVAVRGAVVGLLCRLCQACGQRVRAWTRRWGTVCWVFCWAVGL